MKRPPILILVWTAFHAFKFVQAAMAYVPQVVASAPTGLAPWALTIITLPLNALGVVGLLMMRKWAILLLVALGGLNVVARSLSGYDWWAHYPLLGPFVSLFWTALFAGTAAIYWKRMSWKFFGRMAPSKGGAASA
jgi:hypothetical protein